MARASQSAAGQVRIEIIDRFERFAGLRPAWEALEARDPDSTVFLSWAWLAEAFRPAPGRWRVIAAFRGPALVGALPLACNVRWSARRRRFETEWQAGGRLLWSELTGCLCAPGHENTVTDAMAAALHSLPWGRLACRFFAPERRADRFCAAFPEARFRVQRLAAPAGPGRTDSHANAFLNLPPSYEQYLSALGRNTRQRLRRMSRRYLESGALRIDISSGAQLKSDLGDLLELWMRRWAPLRGPAAARQAAGNYLRVLSAANRLDLLTLTVLRDGPMVQGALGHIADPLARRSHFLVAGRDLSVRGGHVGLLLHADAIHRAIGRGYRIYDFGHGDEPYKFQLGARSRRLAAFSIRPAVPGRTALDPLCSREALARAIAAMKAGRLAEAATGCRQVLDLLGDDVR